MHKNAIEIAIINVLIAIISTIFTNFAVAKVISYYPTIYNIKLYDGFDSSISDDNLKKLVDTIAKTYKDYLNEYGKVDAVVKTSIATRDELAELKKENARLSEELAKQKDKIKYLPKDKAVHIDNYELLHRIGKLEMYIKDHIGSIPEELK